MPPAGSMWWPAPAKLNLMLRITGRRADGYHNLQTVFQLLDVGDRLSFKVRADGVIRKLNPPVGIPEDNGLSVRAARLLQEVTGTLLGADITLEKNLPLGGGVGGGSSDAATTLVALNHLWSTRLDEDQLAELGRQIGADVPVFVRGRSAWAEGTGEQLSPMDLPEAWFLVVCPPIHVGTAELFADPRLNRAMPPITREAFLRGESSNAFEPVAVQHYPLIGEALDTLRPHGQPHLTGTGACVFCAFASKDAAERAQTAIPHGWKIFIARGVNISPLKKVLEGLHGARQSI